MLPVFNDGGLGEVVIDSLFVELILFVGSEVYGPSFIRESWVGVGGISADEVVDIGFGYVVCYDIVLCHRGEQMEEGLIILVAFDPNLVDCDWKSYEFGANDTKKIEVRLLGFER